MKLFSIRILVCCLLSFIIGFSTHVYRDYMTDKSIREHPEDWVSDCCDAAEKERIYDSICTVALERKTVVSISEFRRNSEDHNFYENIDDLAMAMFLANTLDSAMAYYWTYECLHMFRMDSPKDSSNMEINTISNYYHDMAAKFNDDIARSELEIL